MKSLLSLLLGVVAVGLCAATAFAVDTNWTNDLQTMTFYQGDSYGTVCQDIYIDQNGGASNVNFNGQGINLRWFNGGQKVGYVRFQNWESQIPTSSFIYKADMVLTARSNGTGAAGLIIGARGAVGFEQTTDTWLTMAANFYYEAPYNGNYQYNHLYKRDFSGGALLAGMAVTCNVSPAARAWFDWYQNRGSGYTNAGVWMNHNSGGSGHSENSESFYDSEDATPANRPRLVVQYLPPTSAYQIYLYQATIASSNTPQVMNVTPEDTYLCACNWNNQQFWSTNDNYGGYWGPQALFAYDSRATNTGEDVTGVYPRELFRWTGMTYPPRPRAIVDVKLRIESAPGWNDGDNAPSTMYVLKVTKPWVEGNGISLGKGAYATAPLTTSQTNATWCNYNAVPSDPGLLTNAWERHGASGPTDTTNLFTYSHADRYGEMLASDSNGLLCDLVKSWFDGAVNNGLALTSSNLNTTIKIGTPRKGYTSVYAQTDPYHGAGLLVVFKMLSGTLIYTR